MMVAHKTTLQGVVYQLDIALQNMDTQKAGLVFIYDMSASKYSNFDYELSQKILTLLKVTILWSLLPHLQFCGSSSLEAQGESVRPYFVIDAPCVRFVARFMIVVVVVGLSRVVRAWKNKFNSLSDWPTFARAKTRKWFLLCVWVRIGAAYTYMMLWSRPCWQWWWWWWWS